MKFLNYFIVSIVIYTYSFPVQAFSNPLNFTGAWVLDSKASDKMDAIFDLQRVSWIKKKLGARLDAEQIIRQTPEGLTVIFDNLAGKITQNLYFDGKEHLTKNPAGHDVRLTTSWYANGKVLKVTGPAKTEDGLEGILTEVRTLSTDETTMLLTITVELPNGKRASVKRVFQRNHEDSYQ